jgi:hypothetical protein
MATKAISAAFAGLLLLAGRASLAEEFDLTLRAGAGYSDNVNRTSTDETSSNVYAPGLDINYRETTRRLDATVTGDLDYLTYSAQGLNSQLVGNFYGDVSYGIVPESFVWNFDESYGQGRADLFQPSNPQNTQGINYFSTGPELTLPLSNRMFVTANASYANSWYQDQNTDSNQYGGGLALGRSLSQATKIAAAVEYTRIAYMDPNAGPDSDLWQYYLTYSAKGARSTLDLDAGYRSFDDGSGRKGGPLIRFNLTRQLSAYSSIFLLAGDEYSDAASQLNGTLATPGSPGGTNGYSNGEVFVDTYGGGGITFSRMRTRFDVAVTYHDQNYVQGSANDVHRWNVNGDIERDLSHEWSAGFQFWYYHEDYVNAGYSDAELDYSLYANWQFARTVGLSVEWNRWQSSASNQPDANENQYWLRLNWHAIHRPGRTRSGAPTPELQAPPPPGS